MLRAVFSKIYGREAMGLGDVFIVAGIAMHLGWHATLVTFFFLAAVLGAVIGSLFQIPRTIRAYKWSKRRSKKYGAPNIARAMARHSFRKSLMPFGPMLAIGAVAAMLYGQQINDFYIGLYALPPASSQSFAPSIPGASSTQVAPVSPLLGGN